MKPMKKFSKIGQFKDVVGSIKHRVRKVDEDENGESVFDDSIELPTLEFEGTVKLHGTSGGIQIELNEDGSFKDIQTQSRKNVITPRNDNNDFSNFIFNVIDHEALVEDVRKVIHEDVGDFKEFTVFGEWAGKGINKGTAINELTPAYFFVFAVAVFDEEDNHNWVPDDIVADIEFSNDRVYNIHDFPKFKVTVDFNYPKSGAEEIDSIVEQVERECPVGKELGLEGTGEGLVFKPVNENWSRKTNTWFKAKGEKHKDTKTKEKTPVDHERVESIKKMVDSLLTETRLEKGIEHLKENGKGIDRKNLGDFLKWVQKDVMEEEGENIKQNGFEPKELNKQISNKAKEWFFEKEEEATFG